MWLYRTVPRAFVPEEDAGYFITLVQAPAGSSLEHTGTIARQAEQVLLKDPDIEGVFSVMGFSFSGAAPNQGLIFSSLKPFAQTQRNRARAQKRPGPGHADRSSASAERSSSPFAPPSIPGLGQLRRLRVPGPRSVGRRHQRAGGGDVRRWSARATASPRAGRAVQLVHGERPAVERRDRPRARACAGCAARARSRARCRSSSARRTSTTSTSTTARTACTSRRIKAFRAEPAALEQAVRADADRADAAARATSCAIKGDDGAAGHQPLQPVPLGDHQRLGASGIQLGTGAAGDGSRRASRRCRRA